VLTYLIIAQMKSDNSGKYSKGDLSASMIDFFHGGTETTSTTLKWVLLYLALNQVCQNLKKICETISSCLLRKIF